MFALATEHHQAGRLAQAEDLYRKVLAADPGHAESLHLFGVTAYQQGRHLVAIDLMGKAISSGGGSAQCHYNIGLAFAALGRMNEAIAHNRRAIELQPDHADAHNNLAAAFRASGRASEAITHYRIALDLKPGVLETYDDLARLLLAHGNADAALAVVRRSLSIREAESNKGLFIQCITDSRINPRLEDVRDLLVRAMVEPWGRTIDLARIASSLVRQDAALQACVERSLAAWPRRLATEELYDPTDRFAIFANSLLHCLLTTTVPRDLSLERFLTNARYALLDLAASVKAEDVLEADALQFYCALARQCFTNEYVFDCTESEQARVQALCDLLAGVATSGAQASPLWPVAIAAYLPLHSLPTADILLARSWPHAVTALLVQQIGEPGEERRLRSEIPAVTTIGEDTSARVRRQYEDNPYPRWIEPMPPSRPAPLDELMGRVYARASVRRPARASVDVLVAGCGTGRQAISTAQDVSGARVLAVDLSLASLAYAKRKTEALGLRNIEYAQADIMQLGSIGRMFDLVEAGGVLHHLADPWAGWRVLLDLLRPQGFMHVGLYSALARPSVVSAWRFIAERGYGPNSDDMRACRQELLRLSDEDPAKILTQSTDFFTMSGCRDLMFHAQEHHLTLPEIQAFLSRNGLVFLGFFRLDAHVIRQFETRFPDDTTRTNLDNWHVFETENPHTFAGMYMFTVQKQ